MEESIVIIIKDIVMIFPLAILGITILSIVVLIIRDNIRKKTQWYNKIKRFIGFEFH